MAEIEIGGVQIRVSPPYQSGKEVELKNVSVDGSPDRFRVTLDIAVVAAPETVSQDAATDGATT